MPALLRIEDRDALRSARIREPFGYFIAFVPATARNIVVTGQAADGAVVDRLRYDPIVNTLDPHSFIAAEQGATADRTLELQTNRHGGVYMGVRCLEPNSVKCDRVGLAVWLKDPAKGLVAEIEGRRIELVSPGEFVPGKGTGWEGELEPAGLRDRDGPLAVEREPGQPADYWSGVAPVEVTIRLTATYDDGTTASKTVRTPLRAGWG